MRRRYHPRYQWLFIRAMTLAALNAVHFALWPYRRVAPRLGRCVSAPVADAARAGARLTPAQRAAAQDVRWAMGQVLRRIPFRLWCVPQALTARALLRGGVPWVIYVGYQKDRSVSEGQTKHAWLLCADVRVTGYPEALSHVPIAGYLPEGDNGPSGGVS